MRKILSSLWFNIHCSSIFLVIDRKLILVFMMLSKLSMNIATTQMTGKLSIHRFRSYIQK